MIECSKKNNKKYQSKVNKGRGHTRHKIYPTEGNEDERFSIEVKIVSFGSYALFIV